ncbi:hypothetical protein E5288_WYG011823 [Bos mutus]|uniref:Uncharacterized protein n=1 Tax=Bos mutus TaxID=72004 RepID=A0A6B0RVS9_9CETA|nr:hypothetical protein [Bos mutus]
MVVKLVRKTDREKNVREVNGEAPVPSCPSPLVLMSALAEAGPQVCPPLGSKTAASSSYLVKDLELLGQKGHIVLKSQMGEFSNLMIQSQCPQNI